MNARTRGAHHIGLTIPNLAQTRAFFVDVLGFEQVGERPEFPAVFLSDGATMITLWQAADPEAATPFDRRSNVGLHHLALQVPSAEELESLHEALLGAEHVRIEFGPEPLGQGPARHLMCAIPGGVRVEFIAA